VRLADISYYQASVNFVMMKDAGLQGVIIRAGQRYWVDIRFKENWAKAKAAGLPRGSYWLYDSREDPKKQAALWWSLIRDDTGELVHVADLEEGYGGPYGSGANMRIFVQEFQRLSGLPDARIAIYTGYYWWNSRVGNDTFFKRFNAWIAWYASMSVVRVPLPWSESDLIFWQYTSSGDGFLYGVSSREIDLDWYCCDLASFVQRFNLGGGGIPPGGTMSFIITPDKAIGSKIRADHSILSGQIGGLPYGKRGYGDARWGDGVVEDWIHITEYENAQGGLVPLLGWIAGRSAGVKVATITVITDPPPPDPLKVPFTILVEGFKQYNGELEKE
jgi:GH25 family lysozyme M1 (1,4-beta-N-acetylmuramidase)